MSVGDIGAVLSTLEFDAVNGEFPQIIHVAGDIFLLAYQGTDNDGFLATITIARDGTVAASGAPTVEFDAADMINKPSLINIAGSMFAVAYAGPSNDGFVKTFTVDALGTISAIIDTLEFATESSAISFIKILPGNGDFFVICYSGSSIGFDVVTVDIDSAGVIANAVTATQVLSTASVVAGAIVNITGSTFLATAREIVAGNDNLLGWTFSVSAAGAFTLIEGPTTIWSAGAVSYFGDLIKVSPTGTIYAIGYAPSGTSTGILTFDCSDAGTIGSRIAETVILSAIGSQYTIINVEEDLFALTYQDGSSDGFLATIRIPTSGLTGSILSTTEFEPTLSSGGNEMGLVLLPLSDNIFVVAHEGVGADGFVRTMKITTGRPGTYWTEGADFHYFDENGVERTITGTAVGQPDPGDVKSVMGL